MTQPTEQIVELVPTRTCIECGTPMSDLYVFCSERCRSVRVGPEELHAPVAEAFRRAFSHNPEINELTPLGFFQAGWQAALNINRHANQDRES